MRPFKGFDRPEDAVPIPVEFFTDVLPYITDRAELMVTLYAWWMYHRGGAKRPFFRKADVVEDEAFFAALEDAERPAEDALHDGIVQAVARGTLLHVRAKAAEGTREEDWYCLNTPENRERVEMLADGYRPHVGSWAWHAGEMPDRVRPVRPNIFTLYEQNIGLLQPIIVDELREAERTYPPEWIEEAFHIAAQHNVRNWKYVRAILERWAREGRGHGKNRRRA